MLNFILTSNTLLHKNSIKLIPLEKRVYKGHSENETLSELSRNHLVIDNNENIYEYHFGKETKEMAKNFFNIS